MGRAGMAYQRVRQQHQGAELQERRREPEAEVEQRVEQAERLRDQEGRQDPHANARREGDRHRQHRRGERSSGHAAAERSGRGVDHLAVADPMVPAGHGADDAGDHEDDGHVGELRQQRLDQVGAREQGTFGVHHDVHEGAADTHGRRHSQHEQRAPPAARRRHVPGRFGEGDPHPGRPDRAVGQRHGGRRRFRNDGPASAWARRRRPLQNQALPVAPPQDDPEQQQGRQVPEHAADDERRRHLQDAGSLLAGRPEIGLLLDLGKAGRVQKRGHHGVSVATPHDHHRHHPDHHQPRRHRERADHAPGPDGGIQEQGAQTRGRRQCEDQERVAEGEDRLRPHRVGRDQAERAERRDQQEPDRHGQSEHAAQRDRAEVAPGQERRQGDRRRQHHLVQPRGPVANDDLSEEPGPGEDEPHRLPCHHQVDDLRAVARHVDRAVFPQVVRVQQDHHQVGDVADEDERDDGAPTAGPELVPSLRGNQPQRLHSTVHRRRSSGTPSRRCVSHRPPRARRCRSATARTTARRRSA